MGTKITFAEYLCNDYKYNDIFNYDERVDLFNKCFIPTSQERFTPIYDFFKLLIIHITTNHTGYGHSGSIYEKIDKNISLNNNTQMIVNENSYIDIRYVSRYFNKKDILFFEKNNSHSKISVKVQIKNNKCIIKNVFYKPITGEYLPITFEILESSDFLTDMFIKYNSL